MSSMIHLFPDEDDWNAPLLPRTSSAPPAPADMGRRGVPADDPLNPLTWPPSSGGVGSLVDPLCVVLSEKPPDFGFVLQTLTNITEALGPEWARIPEEQLVTRILRSSPQVVGDGSAGELRRWFEVAAWVVLEMTIANCGFGDLRTVWIPRIHRGDPRVVQDVVQRKEDYLRTNNLYDIGLCQFFCCNQVADDNNACGLLRFCDRHYPLAMLYLYRHACYHCLMFNLFALKNIYEDRGRDGDRKRLNHLAHYMRYMSAPILAEEGRLFNVVVRQYCNPQYYPGQKPLQAIFEDTENRVKRYVYADHSTVGHLPPPSQSWIWYEPGDPRGRAWRWLHVEVQDPGTGEWRCIRDWTCIQHVLTTIGWAERLRGDKEKTGGAG